MDSHQRANVSIIGSVGTQESGLQRIVFDNENAYTYVSEDRAGCLSALKQYIAKKIGKHMNITVLKNDTGQRAKDAFPNLQAIIQTEIEEEEFQEDITMAKRGGFPGGGMPGNMSNLMKQAQRMQKQMEEKTKEQNRMKRKQFCAWGISCLLKPNRLRIFIFRSA